MHFVFNKHLTGCFNWNFGIGNACNSEKVHFLPYVGKAKMYLRGGNLFQKLWQTAEKCRYINFRKLGKTASSQTHFGFTIIGSKIALFQSYRYLQSQNETPCTIRTVLIYLYLLLDMKSICAVPCFSKSSLSWSDVSLSSLMKSFFPEINNSLLSDHSPKKHKFKSYWIFFHP